MQTKEQIIKTVKVVAVCVVLFVLLLVIYHSFIENDKKEKPKQVNKNSYALTEINESYENPSYCSGGYFMVESKENDTTKTIILDNELKVIENITESKNNVYCLYDNYYLINNNGNYSLKRKGSIVKANIRLDEASNEILKDETDNKALFIAVAYLKAVVNKTPYFRQGDFAYAENLLLDINTGQIIDNNITKAYQVKYDKSDDIDYFYVESTNNYLWNLKNKNKVLANKKIIFNRQDQEYVYTNSLNNFIISNDTGLEIADINGNIVVSNNIQTFKIDADNRNYFAVNWNNKYGLINSFDKVVWDFTYDNIVVLDKFIITINDNKLDIYDSMLKKLNAESYNVKLNNFTFTKYNGFYQIKGIIEDRDKELILLDNGSINVINSIRLIEGSKYFYDHDCYFINEDGRYYVYISSDEKKYIATEYKNNVDRVVMLNNNRLYTEFKKDAKIQYGFYRISTGVSLEAYLKDKLDVDLEVWGNDKYVFSRQDNKISVYSNNVLLDEIEALKIWQLKDDYYALQENQKLKLIKIG